MKIQVEYFGLSRVASGVATEALDVPPDCPIAEAVALISSKHEAIVQMLAPSASAKRPSVLLFVNDQQESPTSIRALCEGETIVLLSPIAGG